MDWSSSPTAVKLPRVPASALSTSYCVALVSWYSSTRMWPSCFCHFSRTSGYFCSSASGMPIRSSKSTLW